MENQAFSAICGREERRTGCLAGAIVMRDMQMRVRMAGVMRPFVDREESSGQGISRWYTISRNALA